MRTHKRNIACLFFLLYVLAYAASPLVFTLYCETLAGNGLFHPGKSSLAGRSPFSRSEEAEGILVSNGESPSEGSAFWVLVKKKRAVIPDDTIDEKLQPDETIASEEIVSIPPSNFATVLSPETEKARPQDHHPNFRSHSPPSPSSFLSC